MIGISSDGKIVGQSVSENTLREISEILRKIEPPPIINIDQIDVEKNKQVILLTATPRQSDLPYVFSGRPYQRIGPTTSQMPQLMYQSLLLERNHHIHRWETEIAADYQCKDLNEDEI